VFLHMFEVQFSRGDTFAPSLRFSTPLAPKGALGPFLCSSP
jgi:hypothetical protein